MLNNESMDKEGAKATSSEPGGFEFKFSNQLLDFLTLHNVSIGFTTGQAGKAFLVGRHKEENRLSLYERTFNQSLGFAASADGEQLALGSACQIWRFCNAVPSNQAGELYDKVYIPQAGYTIGNCHPHDVGFDKEGQIIFVNTLFSCVARVSEKESFTPLWKPSFISTLAPEDRCHLTGIGFRDEELRYVTGWSQTDSAEGWRANCNESGFVMDIKTNEIVCEGLSMPYSPRWYQNRLWVLNSGKGEFGYIDMEAKVFRPVAPCAGYARGLDFCGSFAVMGLSKRMDDHIQNMSFQEKLAQDTATAYCGIQWVDLRTGDSAPVLLAEGKIETIYDVTVLPNTRTPMLVGFKGDEIYRYMVFNQNALEKV